MGSLKHLNKYIFRYKYRLLLGVLFVVVAKIFLIYPVSLIKETFNLVESRLTNEEVTTSLFFYDMVKDWSLTNLLLLFTGILFLLAIINGIFTFFMRQTIIVVSRKIEYDLKNEIFDKYQKLGAVFYKENSTGDIMNRISEDVSKVRMYLGPGLMYSINLFFLFIMIIPIMFSINFRVSVFVLAPLPIMVFLIYFVSNKLYVQGQKVQKTLSNITGIVQENYSGIKMIKSFVKENIFFNRLNKQNEQYLTHAVRLSKIEAVFFPLILLLIGISTILTIYIGGLETINGNITYGNIVQFVFYINMLAWPVVAMGWVSSVIQQAAVSQGRINEFLNEPIKPVNPVTPSFSIQGDIVFENVSFTYPETGIQALKNVSFEIKASETIGIIGRTGTGKTTLLQLLLGVYDCTEGNIYVNGINIKTLNRSELLENIGVVPQNTFLFSDSIRNNIALGCKIKPEEEKVIAAAKQADIYQDIMGFEKGLDCLVGERGVTLSGGQKQRIAIARAFIKSPDVFLLDDCLSAVDTNTEQHILKELIKVSKNKTTIIVSHRISSIKHADKIIVINEGCVKEMGSHEHLLGLEGEYSRFYNQQLIEKEQPPLDK